MSTDVLDEPSMRPERILKPSILVYLVLADFRWLVGTLLCGIGVAILLLCQVWYGEDGLGWDGPWGKTRGVIIDHQAAQWYEPQIITPRFVDDFMGKDYAVRRYHFSYEVDKVPYEAYAYGANIRPLPEGTVVDVEFRVRARQSARLSDMVCRTNQQFHQFSVLCFLLGILGLLWSLLRCLRYRDWLLNGTLTLAQPTGEVNPIQIKGREQYQHIYTFETPLKTHTMTLTKAYPDPPTKPCWMLYKPSNPDQYHPVDVLPRLHQLLYQTSDVTNASLPSKSTLFWALVPTVLTIMCLVIFYFYTKN